MTEAEFKPLVRFVRGLQPRERPVIRTTARTVDGKTLEGELLNQGFHDLQMRTGDGRIGVSVSTGHHRRDDPLLERRSVQELVKGVLECGEHPALVVRVVAGRLPHSRFQCLHHLFRS